MFSNGCPQQFFADIPCLKHKVSSVEAEDVFDLVTHGILDLKVEILD